MPGYFDVSLQGVGKAAVIKINVAVVDILIHRMSNSSDRKNQDPAGQS